MNKDLRLALADLWLKAGAYSQCDFLELVACMTIPRILKGTIMIRLISNKMLYGILE